MENPLRARLRRGDFLLGSHINTTDPTLTECMGRTGIDYIWVDTEHTAIDYATLQHHLIAARAAGCPALVRVPWNEGYLAKRVLEMGPEGIVFPMIRSPEEGRRAIAACRYPPEGDRSFGPIRAAGYGAVGPRDFAEKEAPPCCFLQIEHKDAVACLEAILDLPGLDGLILGPCDLSASLGILGQMEDGGLNRAIDTVIEKCHARKMPIGVSLGLGDAPSLLAWKNRGVDFMSVGNEYAFLMAQIAALRKLLQR